MRIDNVPELRSKINQLPATFIQDKKKKKCRPEGDAICPW